MDVAAKDAGEEGPGDFGEDFFAKVAADEVGYGLVAVGCGGFELVRASEFGGVGGAGLGCEERRA